ncbi:AraC family transcriptional regulator [Acinetobacter sp. XS-4]|uniref:AraC family transcriptional regulator n=1 Tax=Acinetobacter sp. XS-4 TaxID=2923375 RepID=UPI00208F4520|nr:AraC family transcriptional regulator [Acinetobacter sp. XS-4]USP42109.1 AraC family transcriptional regulator [Acinetobacter sp. XS-4]
MMRDEKTKNTIPGAYIALIADVASRWEISKEDLLQGTGIQQEKLLEPLWHVDFNAAIQTLHRALTLTKEPSLAFGFYLGMQMTVTCHGLIGFAALAAKNVHDALKIAQEFISLQSTIHKITLEIDNEYAYLNFNHNQSYLYIDVVHVALLLGFVQMGKAVSGHSLTGYADVEFERPEYFEDFEKLLPGKVNYKQPYTRLVFQKEILEIPLLTSDPITERLMREQCKAQLRNFLKKSDFTSLVQDLVYDEVMGISTITEVCKKLDISERTLQRKLLDEQTNFRDIVENVRCNKALGFLKNRSLSLNYIADHLGYTDVTNFSRAFKRWTGRTPRRYES